MKKNILITGGYLPGKLFGGPVKSLHNMVEAMGDNYNFHIITGDRDLNSEVQYSGVDIGKWNNIGKAKVLYVPNGEIEKYLDFAISEIGFDLIYCSSFFAKASIVVQKMKFFKKIDIPIIVAPRGEFGSGALKIKSFKKKVFLLLYKILRIKNLISYTCTSENDKSDIESVLGEDINIIKAGNIVVNSRKENEVKLKKNGYLKIVTVSRVSRIKNIDYSLKLLKQISNSDIKFKQIIFDIYGPIEDEDYYKECLKIVEGLNENIIVNFMGHIEYDKVVDILSEYHLFLFPTKGENFGHVIQEALLAGCPLLISDQTPWKDLKSKNVGYELPLNDDNLFIRELNKFIEMQKNEYSTYSNSAFEYGVNKVENQIALKENKFMFNKILGGHKNGL